MGLKIIDGTPTATSKYIREQELKVKQLVCKNCKESGGIATIINTRKKICIICGSNDFIEVELPEELTCCYCKKVSKTVDLLKIWRMIPFYDDKTKTYYCGCRGWE